MSNEKHLEKMSDFATAFADFQSALSNAGVNLTDEENICRLFDIWLANYKDEKVLSEQLKKQPWEDTDWTA